MSTALEQFPIRLRYYRVLRGWKQSDLARAAGLPQSSVSFF
ncbi:MAG: helix-turn-helix transcriptional regulator, partial [Deltaproteobacteria bacterium]|nr:helix-turn-helix transcriptional regulator [Deltaproteobacteria bacterium]